MREEEAIDAAFERFEAMPEVKNAVKKAVRYLEYNPRKIKRFLNEFRIIAAICDRRKLLAGQKTGVIRLEVLAMWVLVEMRYPNLITILCDRPDFAARLHDAAQLKAEIDTPSGNLSEADFEVKAKLLAKMQVDELIARFIGVRAMIELLDEIDRINPACLKERHLIFTWSRLRNKPYRRKQHRPRNLHWLVEIVHG